MNSPPFVRLISAFAVIASLTAFEVQAAEPSSSKDAMPAVNTSATPSPSQETTAPTPASSAPPASAAASAPKKPAATDRKSAQPKADTSATDAKAAPIKKTNDRLELGATVVTGNRELPKVLYIVPWKKADIGELPGQPFNTLLDEVLTPVDREVFKREVAYYGAVSGGAQAPAADGSAAPAPPAKQ